MYLFKNKGISFGRVVTVDNGIPDIAWTELSDEAGLTTPEEIARDDEGWYYFPSDNDIYRLRGNELQRIIEREDRNDWIHTYRNLISTTEKENATVWYLPYMRGIVFNFGNNRTASTEGYNNMQY